LSGLLIAMHRAAQSHTEVASQLQRDFRGDQRMRMHQIKEVATKKNRQRTIFAGPSLS
jgi:hypothetical protein